MIVKTPTCKWVELARERHERDLLTGHERGLWFDEQAADRAVALFPAMFNHIKGEWAGRPFELDEWQATDLVRPLFGWKKLPPGMTPALAEKTPFMDRLSAGIVRRFQTAYWEMGRKNGKSMLAAGIGLILTVADFEMGAEVYATATKRDQAKVVHGMATQMVKKGNGLLEFVKIARDNLSVPEMFSKFEPLGADANTLDGLDPHGNVIDEYHAHKTSSVKDVMTSGQGSRRQPLTLIITTAGFNQHSPCFDEHRFVEQLLEGVVDNDQYFGIIYTLDEGDDWKDPKNWAKANPGIGVSPKLEYIESQVRIAKQKPSDRNNVLVKNLNIWVQQSTRFLDLEFWDRSGFDADPVEWRARKMEELAGYPCMGGLDLGSTSDFTAFCLVFEADDGGYLWLPWFWLPEDTVDKREENLRRTYEVWHRQEFLTYTQGNVTDYDVMRATIGELGERFSILSIGVDRNFQGAQCCTNLQKDGFDIYAFGQGFMSMTNPTKALEETVLREKLYHGNNPVMRWMASNVEVKTDEAGNIKPKKPMHGSPYKIDGIVAGIEGIGMWLDGDIEETRSRYENAGARLVTAG